MKSLYEAGTLKEALQRVSQVRPDSERQWGKMDPAQMFAHCAEFMEMASGSKNPPRGLLSRVFGPVAKRVVLSEKPIRRNMPSDKSLIVRDERKFAVERQRLVESLERFASSGPEGCTKHPHLFFGPLTPDEWAKVAYKHLDHHLRQFGA
jgi:hypothetical protein